MRPCATSSLGDGGRKTHPIASTIRGINRIPQDVDPSTTRGNERNRKQKTRARASGVNPEKHGVVFGTGQKTVGGRLGIVYRVIEPKARVWVGEIELVETNVGEVMVNV